MAHSWAKNLGTSNKGILAQKNFKFHAGVKKYHFGNSLDWAGMAVPCWCLRLKIFFERIGKNQKKNQKKIIRNNQKNNQ